MLKWLRQQVSVNKKGCYFFVKPGECRAKRSCCNTCTWFIPKIEGLTTGEHVSLVQSRAISTLTLWIGLLTLMIAALQLAEQWQKDAAEVEKPANKAPLKG